MGTSQTVAVVPLLLLPLLVVACAAQDPLLSPPRQPLLWAVVPDLPGPGPGDEGFALWSPTEITLTGWTVTDGETTWSVPEGTRLGPDAPAWFTGAPSAWAAHGMPEAGLMDLRLGNGGDTLHLVRPDGTVADAFAWGDAASDSIDEPVRYTSPGTVYLRRNSEDTDTADDWRTPRVHRVGESRLDRPTWQLDAVTLYTSPDSSHDVLTGMLAGATERVALHVYELRSASLADALVDAASRAPVDVLVTKSPVGMDTSERHETAWALQRIEDAGGDAYLAGRGRYVYHHLKVLVADDAVAVQSENWVPSGVPVDPSWGNRGWGIVLHGSDAADWFAEWMAEDRAAWDTEPFDLASFAPGYVEPVRLPARTGTHTPVPPLVVPGPVHVRPVVAPDHTADPDTDPIAQTVREARHHVVAQQLDLSATSQNRLGWSGSDVLLEALMDAAARGVDVRVQAAPPFARDDAGNEDALEQLRMAGARTSDAVPASIATLHNKGIVADDVVVVGSVNGNHHSRSANREVAVVVSDARVADWYVERFEADWSTPGLASSIPSPAPWILVAVALGLARWRSTRSPGSCWASSPLRS